MRPRLRFRWVSGGGHRAPSRLRVVELAGDVFDDWCYGGRPGSGGLGEMVGEGWEDPADTALGFVEVFGSEDMSSEEVEEVGVGVGAGGFHEVEGEGGSGVLVGVEDPDAGVEAHGVAGEGGFGFEQGVQVVEDGVGGVGGASGAGGDWGATGAEAGPVCGDPGPVCCDEADRFLAPFLPVDGCRLGFDEPKVVDVFGFGELVGERLDGIGDGWAAQGSGDACLAVDLAAEDLARDLDTGAVGGGERLASPE